jgi:phospholipid transport system transporter-binding protein
MTLQTGALSMNALKLPPTLLHEQADACLSQWVNALQGALPSVQPDPVRVDASALSDFDSSALAVLLGLRRVAKAQGRAVLVEGMSARLRELATLYGVLELLQPV